MSDQVISVEPVQTPKKITGARILLVVVALLLVAVIVLLTVFPDALNLDKVGRYFNYMGLENKAGFGSISFDPNTTNDYAAFSGGLCVGSESGLTLFDIFGEQEAVVQGSLPSPLVQRCDKLCVCYSPGSSYLAALNSSGDTLIDQTVSGLLLDLDLSDDGYLCYTTSESGVKSMATVLNQNLDPYFKLSSRTRYLNVCAVSPGGTYLAVAGLGEENSTYRSVLTILRTDEALPDLDGVDSTAVRMDLGNQIIYDLKFMSQTQICAIGQNSVLLMDVDGNLIKEYDLAQKKLKDYAFSDKGFLALALSQNQAGDKHELLVLDADGIELADEVLQSRVRSISADGKYIGVLTDRAVQIYNRKLELYAQTPELETATKILVRSDGSALLVSSSEAKLYIP